MEKTVPKAVTETVQLAKPKVTIGVPKTVKPSSGLNITGAVQRGSASLPADTPTPSGGVDPYFRGSSRRSGGAFEV